MHDTAMNFVEDALRRYQNQKNWSKDLVIVEFGAYNVNGTIRDLFDTETVSYVGVDLQPGPFVDVIKDAALVTKEDIGNKSSDIIVTANVFEHVENWIAIVENAYTLLNEGGWFIVQCAGPGFPQHSGKIESPHLESNEWYRNIPHEELHDAMIDAGFKNVSTHWRDNHPHDTTGIGVK